MKVNQFNLVSFKPINHKIKSANNLERTPNTDVISFAGKTKQPPPHVVTATTFGTQLYKSIINKDISFEDVKNLLLKYSDDVDVLPIQELDNVEENAYVAYAISNLKNDFTFGDRRIYLDTLNNLNDNTSKLLFATNTAHEYTHIKQAEENIEGEFLKNLSGGDYDYARAILAMGEHVFKPFDTELQHKVLMDMLNQEDIQKVFTYKTVVPRQCNVNEQMIYKAFGVRNRKEFENIINKEFNKIYILVLKSISYPNSPILDYIPEEKIRTDLYSSLRKFCANQARNEAEAYTTENRVAKKVMNINKNLTTDIIPMYYEMIAECFEKNNNINPRK